MLQNHILVFSPEKLKDERENIENREKLRSPPYYTPPKPRNTSFQHKKLRKFTFSTDIFRME